MFKDHFSDHANRYAQYRPRYPKDLVDFFMGLCPQKNLAWDVGCGNGQIAEGLANIFQRVIATDGSRQQIEAAIPRSNIDYRVILAEEGLLVTDSVDLIVAAQSAHWFDLSLFYQRVYDVTHSQSVLALVCYQPFYVESAIDSLVSELYQEILAPFWPPERKLVDEGYRNIPFPFREVTAPDFTMVAHWNLRQFCGYLATWSAVKNMITQTHQDPLANFCSRLSALWPGQEEVKTITWPIKMRVGFPIR